LGKPTIQVLNKIDLLTGEARDNLRQGKSVAVSAREGEGLEELINAIDELLVADPVVDAVFVVPQYEGGVLAALDAGAVIRRRTFEADRVRLELTLPASLLGRYREFCIDN
jgi:GTPase